MKVYSKNNLLQKSTDMKTTWLNIVNLSSVILELNIPDATYFRMKVLCEDISELSGQIFNQQKMIDILWSQFIDQVKRVPDFKTVHDMLIEREDKRMIVKDEIVQKKNTFMFFETSHNVAAKTNKKVMQYRMNRKQALRGEIMLADIAEIKPDHQLTLERVLEIIFCDFIEKYKQGESEQAVKQIIDII